MWGEAVKMDRVYEILKQIITVWFTYKGVHHSVLYNSK